MKTEINNFKFYILIAILFFVIPKVILAEDLAPVDQAIFPQEEFVTNTNNVSTSTTDEQIEESTTTTENIATTTEEIPQNFSAASFSEENLIEATNTITVNLNVRYQDNLVFSGPITLTKDATTTVVDNTNTDRKIITNTAFGALNQADTQSPNFNISNLAYYASWNAFLINCIDVATSTNSSLINACYNWQYVVNDSYPFVGSDQYNLSDGDNIYFYFGAPRIIELSTSTILAGDSFTATAKSYDYQNNIYVPAPNYTVGVTQPDPNNPWSPTVLFSSTTNQLGQSIFTINQPGSYGIGIAEDYYSILENLSVIATSSNVVATSSVATTTDSGSGNNTSTSLNISKALEFLSVNQSSDGSFGDDLYTDWAAIGLAAAGSSNAKTLIKNYLLNQKFSADNLTDNERHAMALMSLGINPYTGTKTNYIEKIIEEFDGKQFGDEGLINDDIFALLPLLNAGYNSNDTEISKTVAYVISKQNSNGSWESVDLTAAAIQALSLVTDLPNVNSALEKATTYLKNSKQGDGSFGNIFSNLWVKQVLSDDVSNDYLVSKQNSDGGLETGSNLDSRIWATSYLLPAYYGKSWDALMSNFKKPKIESGANDSTDSSENNIEEITEPETFENTENLVDDILTTTDDNLVSDLENLDLENNKGEVENSEDNIKETDNIETQNNLNLQANVLGSFENLPIIKTFTSIFSTTLAGLGVMWGFIATVFKI